MVSRFVVGDVNGNNIVVVVVDVSFTTLRRMVAFLHCPWFFSGIFFPVVFRYPFRETGTPGLNHGPRQVVMLLFYLDGEQLWWSVQRFLWNPFENLAWKEEEEKTVNYSLRAARKWPSHRWALNRGLRKMILGWPRFRKNERDILMGFQQCFFSDHCWQDREDFQKVDSPRLESYRRSSWWSGKLSRFRNWPLLIITPVCYTVASDATIFGRERKKGKCEIINLDRFRESTHSASAKRNFIPSFLLKHKYCLNRRGYRIGRYHLLPNDFSIALLPPTKRTNLLWSCDQALLIGKKKLSSLNKAIYFSEI